MSSPTLPSIPPLGNTFGALLIGCICSATLYGMSVVQFLYYHARYSKDAWYLRLLVIVTFICDTIPTALIIHSIYFYLILNFANPAVLELLIWSVLVQVVFVVLTSVLVQCFFTLRVWRMSRNRILVGIILLLIVCEFGLGVVWLVGALQMKTMAELRTNSYFTMSAVALQAAVDTIIAVSLCIMLHCSRTGFKQTNVLINKMIFFFVNTGLVTSVCAIGVVVSTAASPDTLIYAAWYFCIGRLYTNSLFAALNSREIIHGRVECVDISMCSELARRVGGATTCPTGISIVIATNVDDDSDPSQRKAIAETGHIIQNAALDAEKGPAV